MENDLICKLRDAVDGWPADLMNDAADELERGAAVSDGHFLQAMRSGAKVNELRDALEAIAALDPATNSEDGFNEWGEADCFRQAQALARKVLGDAQRTR